MNWKKRVCVLGLYALIAVAIAAALLIPADNTGQRFLHALFAVIIVGVLAAVVLMAAMFVLAIREARTQARDR